MQRPSPSQPTIRTAVLVGLVFTALLVELSPLGAQTMDAALARAYVSNPTLNAERASVRVTN